MTPIEKRIWKYVTKWRRKLRLNDWRIELIVVSKNDTNWHRNKYGDSQIVPQLKSATLRIAEPRDEVMGAELEATVIHELLHIHFDPYPWGRSKIRDTQMEATVDQLAICLLQLDSPDWVDPRDNLQQ